MLRTGSSALLAVAITALTSVPAFATEYLTQNISMFNLGGTFTGTSTVGGKVYQGVAFNNFDQTLGTLSGVNLRVNGKETAELTAINSGSTPDLVEVDADPFIFAVDVGGLKDLAKINAFGMATSLVQANATSVFKITTSALGDVDLGATIFGLSPASPVKLAFAPPPSLSIKAGSDTKVITDQPYQGTLRFSLTYAYTPATPAPPPTSPVPEPSSWALMLAGFGLVGAVTRARPEGRRPRSKLAI